MDPPPNTFFSLKELVIIGVVAGQVQMQEKVLGICQQFELPCEFKYLIYQEITGRARKVIEDMVSIR